jgi:hypothetical protein
MSHGLAVFLFLLGLFVGMVLLHRFGRQAGKRQLASGPADLGAGLGPLEGAIFGLLGLLVAFTFSGAASRFDARRNLIVHEANAISTAYLRLDVLPAAAQPALREDFRQYTDTRLEAYRLIPTDVAAAQREFARAVALQLVIWQKAVLASRDSEGSQAARLLLPALNEMFDVATTRAVAAETHAPNLVFAMLGLLALVCSFIAGAATAHSPRAGFVQVLAFPVILVVTVYVILDLEYPRAGLIRIDAVDQVIADVRESMK